MTAFSLDSLWTLLREGRPPAEEQPTDRTKRISDHLVRLVQVFFGVVAGQGLVLYRGVVTSPFAHDRIPATLALVSIYVMIVWSWIDWNSMMEDRPYDLHRVDSSRFARFRVRCERWRFYSDIVIVVLYSYMLFQVTSLVGPTSVGLNAGQPNADIRYLLLGYPLVFALYVGSGELRILRYGPKASNLRPIFEFLTTFVALLFAYVALRATDVSDFWLNVVTLVVVMIGTYSYRSRRRRYSEARK